MESLGINFPFTETQDGGIIGVVKTDVEKTRADLTAFLTLKKGQRVMNNSLYSPLYDYLMEGWDDITQSEIRDALTQKLAEFFPEIKLIGIEFEFDDTNNILNLKIIYSLVDLKITDSVSIALALGAQQ